MRSTDLRCFVEVVDIRVDPVADRYEWMQRDVILSTQSIECIQDCHEGEYAYSAIPAEFRPIVALRTKTGRTLAVRGTVAGFTKEWGLLDGQSMLKYG